MKFGRKITASLYDEWKPYYIDYNLLKRELKARTTSHNWDDKDEHDFTVLLKRELDKIHDFQKQKTSELSQRIRDAERDVKRLVAQQDSSQSSSEQSPISPTDPESLHPHTSDYGPDEGSDDEDELEGSGDSYDELDDLFHGLEAEVATLVADVHDLALYTKLNITGFLKILKKHDKQTNLPLKPTFIQEYLEERPFYKYNWDALILKLSKLYNLIRTRGHPIVGDSSAGGNQSAFVRQTTKYWVHPDNLVPLKLAILKHLPVLVFNAEKEFESKDAAITSIYFDNEDLDLYLGRLEKTEGAEAIRLRWYGDTHVKTIFVERKTHREDWTGEKSVKARFPIKEHLVNAFLRGEYTMDAEMQALVDSGKKSQSEVDVMIQLANEVQYRILTCKLVPVTRTFYNRTAFQLPGDARVRISLDTELTMIREDNWDGRVRSGDNWRRTDIGIDHPFDRVPAEDKELFKYGVLEVKLQTQFGQQPPRWVTELVQSHLVEAVPKFSKFIHGCATLLPNRTDLVPFWLPQMDTDILKPSTGYLSVERPIASSSRVSLELGSGRSGDTTPTHTYDEPISEGEEDEVMDLVPAKDVVRRTGLSHVDVAAAIAYRETSLKKRVYGAEAEEEEQVDERTALLARHQEHVSDQRRPQQKSLSINPLASSTAFDNTLKEQLNGVQGDNDQTAPPEARGLNEEIQEEERLLVRDWIAPSGKKIAVPVRIEPKVYFANERTFLRWLHFAVLISSIATTLLNFIPPDDTGGLISAGLFTLAALLSIAYSAIIFVYRALRLRARSAEGLYYDKYGPTILCLVLFAALAVNVGLRLAEMGQQ
ncbi:VTC domain-containing protein [Boletus edulis]|uniref:Vacuolar transporter chaperone complex subunit 4 n=1 Tax=Boletus edulis BED1 TaxID=1328754 RepID=A0AAD4BUK5_BOLED|nr:VTC domain-containing protein [Boletus edulis]KAF8440347.1 VTC domain-containing protein [Boletus edulis BED1]